MPDQYDRYVEPFCGSASLFFQIPTTQALLSDINAELINAWSYIRAEPSIRNDLVNLPKTKEHYYETRANDPEDMNDRSRAIRFLYLNRYCFNGVYRTNSKGKFNVPMGTRTGDFPSQESFDYASKKLEHCDLVTCDYKQTLENLVEGDFIYIDPPYSSTDKFTGEYGLGSFSYQELPSLVSMLESLTERGVKFLLSYVANETAYSLLSEKFNIQTITVARHVQGFKSAWGESQEILVKNYD